MWTVVSQKKHNERLGEQQGVAYIRAKARSLRVVLNKKNWF